jgi:hemoglobin
MEGNATTCEVFYTLHSAMKPDIETDDDIKTLIDAFYEKVKRDDLIGYIFQDVAKVDWAHHLPRMYAFWQFLLLGKDTYQGNPMEVHLKLSEKVTLTSEHFGRWLSLFHETIDDHFEGKHAEEARHRSNLIALTWKPKFTH